MISFASFNFHSQIFPTATRFPLPGITAIDLPFYQTLQESCRSFDYQSMVEAEPAIRQLLKIYFDPKVSQTVNRIFRQTIKQTLKTHLLPVAEQQAEAILQQYSEARTYLEQTLAKEAKAKIANNQRSPDNIPGKIAAYNQAVFLFYNKPIFFIDYN